MKIRFSAIILLLILSSSCGKNNLPKPAPDQNPSGGEKPENGSISGKIDPIPESNIVLYAQPAGNGPAVMTGISPDGRFVFMDMPVGNYNIVLPEGAAYVMTSAKAAEVKSGKDTDAGIISVKLNPDNGSITGRIQPLGSAHTALIQLAGPATMNVYSAQIDPATGRFERRNLPPGKYTISFESANYYTAPEAKTVEVLPTQAVDAEGFMFVSTIPASTLIFQGKPASGGMSASAVFNATSLSINAFGSRGSFDDIGHETSAMGITITQFNGPGIYVCKPESTSSVSYSKTAYKLGGKVITNWTSRIGESQITVIITTIDESSKTVEGTFSGTLGSGSAQSSDLEIIQGHFSAVYK